MPNYPAPPVVASQYPINQGLFSARPATGRFTGDAYLVNSGAGQGILYIWNGAAWVQATLTIPTTTSALVNGTGQLGSTFGAPNDGNKHIAIVSGILVISSAETGGAIGISYTGGGIAQNIAWDPGGHAVATSLSLGTQVFEMDANTNGTIQQTSALTAGAAQLLWMVGII